MNPRASELEWSLSFDQDAMQVTLGKWMEEGRQFVSSQRNCAGDMAPRQCPQVPGTTALGSLPAKGICDSLRGESHRTEASPGCVQLPVPLSSVLSVLPWPLALEPASATDKCWRGQRSEQSGLRQSNELGQDFFKKHLLLFMYMWIWANVKVPFEPAGVTGSCESSNPGPGN